MTDTLIRTDDRTRRDAGSGSGVYSGPAAAGTGLGLGTAVLYLSLIVLIPLAAVVWHSSTGGPGAFWAAITHPGLVVGAEADPRRVGHRGRGQRGAWARSIAWVLVRDSFPGKAVVDTLIDLPFALPTIVAGLVLLALYGAEQSAAPQHRLHPTVASWSRCCS